MAEQTEVEQKARKMGWLPETEFRGKKEHWVDAEKYVERGDQFIPFLQADRRRLEVELSTVRGELNTLQTTLKEATETIDTLKEFRTELNKERVKELREDLVDGIKAARADGDVDKEIRLQEKLTEATEALKPVKEEPKVKVTETPDVTKTPEWQDFVKDNPWWNEDPVMRSASVAVGQILAAEGKLEGMTQAQRFAAIAKATKERFGLDEPARTSRVESSRGGSTRQDDTTTEKTYNDLPADAKAGCASFENRLVGKKKGQFPDVAAYRKYYAEEYFRKYPNG